MRVPNRQKKILDAVVNNPVLVLVALEAVAAVAIYVVLDAKDFKVTKPIRFLDDDAPGFRTMWFRNTYEITTKPK